MTSRTLRVALLGLLGLLYTAQLFSPLRANTDAVCFLQMGASASDGHGYVCCEDSRHFPIGYPAILSLLDRAGIACSATIIAINLVSLAVGLVAVSRLLGQSFSLTRRTVSILVIMTLLNWVVVKHVTLPITDILFFGTSLAALAFLQDASAQSYRQKLPSLAVGVALVFLSISVRTVGIALLPSCLFAAFSPSTRSWYTKGLQNDRRILGFSVALGCVGGLGALGVVSRSNYYREMGEHWQGFSYLASSRLSDWGALVLNTSLAKVPAWLLALGPFAGALLAGMVALGAFRRRRLEVVDIYMAGYLAILLLWPYPDARFWIPIIPLLLGYTTWSLPTGETTTSRGMRFFRLGLAPGYLVGYGLLGFVAIGYSTWLSFSGDHFGARFGGGVYRSSYEAAYGTEDTRGFSKNDRPNPQIIRLLDRYQLHLGHSPSRTARAAVAKVHRE